MTWSWLFALPVFIWLVAHYRRGDTDLLGVTLGTLLLGGACIGIAEMLGA